MGYGGMDSKVDESGCNRNYTAYFKLSCRESRGTRYFQKYDGKASFIAPQRYAIDREI
jgi:hypothetical protein